MAEFNLNNSRIRVPDGVTAEDVVKLIGEMFIINYGTKFSGRVAAFVEPSRLGRVQNYREGAETDEPIKF